MQIEFNFDTKNSDPNLKTTLIEIQGRIVTTKDYDPETSQFSFEKISENDDSGKEIAVLKAGQHKCVGVKVFVCIIGFQTLIFLSRKLLPNL